MKLIANIVAGLSGAGGGLLQTQAANRPDAQGPFYAIAGCCAHNAAAKRCTLHRCVFLACVVLLSMTSGVHADVSARNLIIDDRSSGTLRSTLGPEWRLFTDTVMGGVSTGDVDLHTHRGKGCLRMRGDVSTRNNGGFVQIALAPGGDKAFDASKYAGVELTVSGNNERYNLHLRTAGLWLPWQSYRADFVAEADWRTVRIPFADLEPYKTTRKFRADRLERIGLVAIGRDFKAELCLASIRFYAE